MPERERELRELGEVKEEKGVVEVGKDDKYDIITEKKKSIAKKDTDDKEFTKISKNIMTSKNRKLLKVIEHSLAEKQEENTKLKEKSTKMKKEKKDKK